jgi:hypothetical protein
MLSEKYNAEKFSNINKSKEERNEEEYSNIREKIESFEFNDFQIQDLLDICHDANLGNKEKTLLRKMEDFGFEINEVKKYNFENGVLIEIIQDLFE